MIPLGFKDIAVLVGAGLLAVGGWTARGWYEDSRELAAAQALEQSRAVMRELANDVSHATELAIQGIRIENRTIQAEVRREVVEKPVYVDCRLPDSGRVLINKARHRSAAGQPDRALPAAAAAP